ncbi:diguanylate cyclase [Chroococcus sp. FPU101]|uniref:diguanylate cyclase n=1 Tax=Chroococcus sp. FPU101 TaxID=1974212 RepID=UPI001F5D636E|nr:diguanylate cyclase [Chroococcus sp. FPU101]
MLNGCRSGNSNFLQENVRQSDIPCRYGGEELVDIMPNTSIEHTKMQAEEIRQGIKQLKVYTEGKELALISVSIGISSFPLSSYDL